MRFLPLHLDTQDQSILVVGGGPAAEAKLRTLVRTSAALTVVAPEISPEIQNWLGSGRLNWAPRRFAPSDLEGVLLVYAATPDAEANREIAEMARQAGVLVNAADQKADCDFYSPAIVDRSPVVISIGTEGTAPGLARAIKAELESRLPQTLGHLAQTIAALREKIAKRLPDISDRQRLWAKALSGRNGVSRIDQSAETLSRQVLRALENTASNPTGHVSLVGAGPGDADLLTQAARHKLHSADVIVYDRLVGKDVLALARREARFIYVGKTPGHPSISQDEINQILIDEASKGLSVVRLKGGDPLIFGRADEEIDVLIQADIDFDIVPGITAAAAAAASAGVSLTARGQNKAVELITGHDTKGYAEHDWRALAAPNKRAAVYMGVGASRFIQGRLLLHGASPKKPVIIVENASRAGQLIIQTTLENLPQDIEKEGITGPAILLIGYANPKKINTDARTLEAAQ